MSNITQLISSLTRKPCVIMTIFPGAFISTRGHFRCSTYHLPMMSIRQNGSVNKDFEGNFTLKFFQRVYGLTPWVVATFENGRAVLPLYESEIRASLVETMPRSRSMHLLREVPRHGSVSWIARVGHGTRIVATGRAASASPSRQTRTAARGAAVC